MKQPVKFKPELLLPAGSVEAFFAALNGGADAIYLGLKDFNARGRATNFTSWQAAAAIKLAHVHKVKVYIALNTVLKNSEIYRLADVFFVLSQIKPDAVIVQDWGVFYLIKKHFPQLTVHASTQMANHNSMGVNHAAKMGFKRVVLSRELTKTELEEIAKNKKTELEIFVHGALCYSFSGMCLFSSYLGGASANRGQCAQPCRRNYEQANNDTYFFSLKDNQLIDHLPFLSNLKIDSLKVEGRLKSAEYVHQVSTNYRKAIDNFNEIDERKNALRFDLGREKTDYFYGNKVAEAITQQAGTGLLLGTVVKIESGFVTFSSTIQLDEVARLRFRDKKSDQQTDFNINHLKKSGKEYSFATKSEQIKVGDEVYLAAPKMKFADKISTTGIKINDRCPTQKINSIKADLVSKPKEGRSTIYLRIDQLDLLFNIDLSKFEAIILSLSKSELKKLAEIPPIRKQLLNKLHIELPKFIPEADLKMYQELAIELTNKGLSKFFVSHLSQSLLLPSKAVFSTNQNVYAFNDAAIRLLKSEGALHYCYPLENDIVNMAKGSARDGIVPVYFYPTLFYSRMPVKADNDTLFADKNGNEFRKTVRNGVTIVLPKYPVSLTLYREKLERYGFHRFLIDLSFHTNPLEEIELVYKHLVGSSSVPNTTAFNFKRELK